MQKIICAWINCKYNSFVVTEKIQIEIRKGLTLSGSGECQSEKTIILSLNEDEDEDGLQCENYEDACKFDG